MRFLVVIWILFAAISTAAAQVQDLSDLKIGTQNYRFSLSQEPPTTRVTIVPEGDWVRATMITLTVIRIRNQTTSEVDLAGAIAIPEQVDKDNSGVFVIEPLLNISSEHALGGGPYSGTYTIEMIATAEVEQRDEKGEVVRENGKAVIESLKKTISLGIEYPKLSLLAPEPVLIKENCEVWGCDEQASKLVLTATGQIGPSGLRAFNAKSGLNNAEPVPGTLEIGKPEDRQIVQELAVSTGNGDTFPLGETSGKIAVTSPETDRLEVAFKVVRKHGYSWMALVIAFGVLLGYFLRTALSKRIAVRNREISLKMVMRRVTDDTRDIEDKELQAAIKPIWDDIQRHIDEPTRGGDDLSSAITGWEGQLKTALDASATRSQSLETDINVLHGISQGNWSLPTGASDGLDRVARKIGSLRDLHLARRLDTIEKEIGAARKTLQSDLKECTQGWLRQIADVYEKLGNLAPPLPESTAPDFAGIEKALHDSTAGKLDSFGSDPNADLEAVLKANGVAVDAVTRSVYQLRRDVDAEAATVAAILEVNLPPDDLESIQMAREALATMDLAVWVRDPTASKAALPAGLEKALKAIRGAIETAAANKGIDVSANLTAGKYRGAATIVRAAATAGPETTQRVPVLSGHDKQLEGHTFSPSPQVAVGSSLPRWAGAGPPDIANAAPARRPDWSSDRLANDIERLRDEADADTRLQTAVAGTGLVAAGILIFSDTFVGSFDDYLKVFLWGFITDVGVNNMLTNLRGKIPG